jgi:hypothetical protein
MIPVAITEAAFKAITGPTTRLRGVGHRAGRSRETARSCQYRSLHMWKPSETPTASTIGYCRPNRQIGRFMPPLAPHSILTSTHGEGRFRVLAPIQWGDRDTAWRK